MELLTLFIIYCSLVQVYGQAVHNVALKYGEPYMDLKNPDYPKGPMAYDSTIEWNFVVEADSTIKIFCDDIRMGQHQPWTKDCEYVSLSFHEDNGETKLCGPNEGGYRYISKGPRLTVKLIANAASGFVKCTAYNNREPTPQYMDLSPNGRIKFIKNPAKPVPNYDNIWILRSTPNTRISLQCTTSLPNAKPCYKDILTIDTGDHVEEFCGNKKFTLFTTSNVGKVRLQLNEFGDTRAQCMVQAVTGPNANQFLNVVSEEGDSSEQGVQQGTRGTSCKCGWRNKSPGRIIRGKETMENEFPWMVLLNMIREPMRIFTYCGGSIITRRHVLTAAHCLVDKELNIVMLPEEVTMIFAQHHSGIASGKERHMQAKELIVHEGYLKNKTADIAIIFTKENIEFNDLIGPICISPQIQPILNRRLTIMGWGQTEHGRGSDVLLTAKSTVIDNQFCGIRDTEICIHTKPSTPCYGDSGGPLVWLDPETNRYTQVSLVSRGTNPICEEGRGVSTQVASYYNWIQDTIKGTDPAAFTCHKV
uniref:Venom S1 protease with CUB domain 16 n=1 Tax=Oncocephalus sp. TaxID=2944721 RepID=A0AB38ZEU5_9HEMI